MAELTEGASSSFSASSSSGSSKFDVFLNFRGKDTRKNFTGFLHKALKNSGISDFIDCEKLWVGEAIAPALHRAIQGSKIFIPVFSKGYASSKWCLMELSHMLHCHESNGQIIMPIFFDVEPSHVRNQSGSFEVPFREHEKNFEPQIVESWREALRMAGDLKGWVLKEDTDGDQADLVELVVKRVLRELISNTHLAECKYPIGIDSHVNDLVSLLNIGSNDVQFVGICGSGGIGKTSIAKALYNRTLLSFNRHSFLSDVREQAMQFMGLATLQKRLLKDIFKADFDITDSHRGKKLIEQMLCTENVLLVLDDVDNQDQVNALASEISWFGHGSRVIITTRDEHILNVAKVEGDKIYWPQVLHCKQFLKLFSLHAFSRDQPPEDYMQLSHDVACYSGGLPLTLEVLGSYLSDICSKEVWESTLQELKEIPHEKVQRRLKISYDNLNSYHKALFLDAACFFIGWEKETVISIWEACGYHPKSAMDKLIKRSLLKFEDNLLKMHDQIRDMGRNIVLEENPMEPGRRSRLWSHGEILEVLEEKKGTDMIKGMMLPSALPPINLGSEHFEMMHNLRYLDISLANFTGDFSRLPFGLIWFKWFGCPWGTILQTNFYHKRLLYLDLSESDIIHAWNIEPQDENKRFQKLKVLNLSQCQYLSKSPHFSWFRYLEQLDLGYCTSLDKLDDSIGQLSQLKILILCMCQQMKELPESIGDLKSLVKLDLSSLKRMKELPDSISKLSSLKELDLQFCKSLKKLPDSIGDLKSLVKLNLSSIKIMKELPDKISRLNSLKVLDLRFCESLKKLPKSIGDLKSLVELQLHVVSGIEELPDGVGLLEKLEVLDVGYCDKLAKLPISMGRMKCLRSISLMLTKISKLPDDFSLLSNLEEFIMYKGIQSLPTDLSHLRNLKKLSLTRCDKLEYLPELPSGLVVLRCEQCFSLVGLPDLSRLKFLTTLELLDCEKLEEIQGLEGTESLKKLDARGSYILTYTPRKIHGQGTLLPCMSQKTRFSLTVDDGIYDKGLMLCIVLEFPSDFVDQGLPLTFNFIIVTSIHQKDKTIRCVHTLRIEDVKFTTHRHIIYIHHFKGFDWFGIPLQGKDAIENFSISPCLDYNFRRYPTVKMVEILFENREPDQQRPNDQYSIAMMVADFFNWSYVDDHGGVTSLNQSFTCLSRGDIEGSNSAPKEEEGEEGVLRRASNYKEACLAEEIGFLLLVLEEDEEKEKWPRPPRPRKRARLH
ncbi:disease resistance protein RPV1-like [Macadamia integrifolia]|uniref:disease resistance protein RPV1-like n=1 Tax=Macadamia integrifolia TaxID=60698 RepID=UPI001C52E107|nr:disease resistance protein RPV1-like [Macadamia integrifolia]